VATDIPVLEDMNGYFRISLYTSGSDGTFKRSARRPFRSLAGLVADISPPLGRIEMSPRTRQAISWRTPTVMHFEQPRPQSVYRFFRERIKSKDYYIATAKDGLIRTRVLYLHKVNFKGGSSNSIRKLFSDKFIDSMKLYGISKRT